MKELKKFGYTIEFGFGSSVGHPDYKGIQTSDIQLWFKVNKSKWIKANEYSMIKLVTLIEACKDKKQLKIILKDLGYE